MAGDSHQLILMPSGRHGEINHGVTLLDGARQLGIELESICGGRQTCGKCLVAPEYGKFPKHAITSDTSHLSSPNPAEQAYAQKHGIDLSQFRLACATCLEGDILLNVPEGSLARKQIVRKDAGELAVEVKPAVQIVYVEVSAAILGGRADWPRLQSALAEQWHLHDLLIDTNLLPTLQAALRKEKGAVTVTIWQEREVIRVEPGYVESLYGLAVDIGSTTVAGHLCDLRTGAVVVTETMMNPQVRFGEDLISRISYATDPQGMSRLHHAIIKALNDLAKNAAQAAGIEASEITDLVLVGNTVMHHIVLNINPEEIGHLPFALATDEAVDLNARDLGLKAVHEGARVHLLPCIAGYVGADNVAVLMAEYPTLEHGVTLVVDIGTNAEILLFVHDGHSTRILSASSPTGPAFEGAQISHGQRAAAGAIERVRITEQGVRYKVIGDERWSDELEPGESLRPTGICGSGIIEVVAELYASGLIGSDGKFKAASPFVRFNGKLGEVVLATNEEAAAGHEILITQKDIRAIQLAKAALYSGVRLLMDRLNIKTIDYVRLAGAFGSYIDPLYAMRLGLFPDCALSNIKSVGNAAGDGARIALVNVDQRQWIQQLVREVEYVETAAEPLFQDYFVDALTIPHALDPFPHLEEA